MEEKVKKNKGLLFGIHSIIEAIRSGKELEKVLIKRGLAGDLFRELFALIQNQQIPFQYVPLEKIESITRKNHQGVIAWVSEVEYKDIEMVIPKLYEEGKTPFILVLDHLTDVRNFGAIVRTAECAGVHAIVVPTKGGAQINADAIKTSAGALHKVDICRSSSFNQSVKFLKESGLHLVAATEKTNQLYHKADLVQPVAIILGAEDTGISKELLIMADILVKIPLLGEIQSLNVSVAAGILMYEVVKQRDSI